MSMLVVAYWFTIIFLNLLNVVPGLGALVLSLLMPGLSMGLMQAARHLERGQPVGLQTLYGSFSENTKTLLALGGLYLLCSLGVLGVSSLFDGGGLMRYLLSGNRAGIDDESMTLAPLVVMTLMTPVLMAWWFAPALAAWHHQPLGKSLFFSFVACWMNWRPFVVYGLALLVLVVVVPALLLAVLALLMPAMVDLLMALVMAPMVLVVVPIVMASFYACYRDIFGISEIV